MTKKKTKTQFVQQSNEKHDNKYKGGYEKFVYINAKTKGLIFCPEPEHGYFPQTPASHLRGKGCPICGRKSRTSNKEEFEAKANKKHDNKYKGGYEDFVYINNRTKGKIFCPEPEHGYFKQTPSRHLQGSGCAKCGRKRRDDAHRSDTETFIKKIAKKTEHGDTFDYSQVDYKDAKTPVTIICKKHGPFEQTPCNHLQGKGCKKCAIKKMADAYRSDTETFIQKSRANPSCRDYNGDYYDYDLVEYKNAHTKVKIKCLYHNKIFKMIPNNHSCHGQKCRDCGLLCLRDKMTDSNQDIIDKSNKKYCNNFEIKFNNDYTNSHSMIDITCKKHQHSFINTVNNHLNYTFGGCKECATENRKIIKTDEEFKKDVIKVHGNKFKYLTEYTGSHDYLTIECENGHIFKLQATSHLSGSGCGECARKINSDKQRYTHEDFLKKAAEKRGDNFIYITKYTGSHDYLTIKCKKHNIIFTQIAKSHLKGYDGCKKCSTGSGYSKIACEWIEEEIKKDNICIQYALSSEGEFQPIKGKKSDGYCEETNTIYEFHGSYWHGDPKIYDLRDINPTTKKKFGSLFIDTCIREKQYRDAGFKYKCKWESNYNKNSKDIIKTKISITKNMNLVGVLNVQSV